MNFPGRLHSVLLEDWKIWQQTGAEDPEVK